MYSRKEKKGKIIIKSVLSNPYFFSALQQEKDLFLLSWEIGAFSVFSFLTFQ